MSVAATPGPLTEGFGEPAGERKGDPRPLKLLEWSVAAPVSFALAFGLVATDSWRHLSVADVMAWILLVALTDLLPIPLWGSLRLALSLPILLAAAFVYPPEIAAAMAFVASIDVRELRREVSPARALFNRSQIAISTGAASIVFRSFHVSLYHWPLVLVAGMTALLADVVLNWTLVCVGLRIKDRRPVRLFARVSVGDVSAYVAFGLIAILLALAFDSGGTWGLAAVGIPVLLARQVFARSVEMRDMALLLSQKSQMLLAVTKKIADERRDERLAVAAELHDDLMPPLYKVHLLGQVVKQDLATGQLLALDDDVPDLVSATEYASSTARSLIRDLRRSSVGAGGLSGTLQYLIRSVASPDGPHLHSQVVNTKAAPVIELLAYQVAREAIRNAIRHSEATNVWLRLEPHDSEVRLSIEDDGIGFDPGSVVEHDHFGLVLMRERVELVGGVFLVESAPGRGTRVLIRLPGRLDA